MNRSKPQDVLDKLINTLNAVPAESLRTEGEFFKEQLKMLRLISRFYMIESFEIIRPVYMSRHHLSEDRVRLVIGS